MAFNPDPSMSFSDKQEMRRRAQAAPDFVGPSMMDAQTPQRQTPPPAAASLGARLGSAPADSVPWYARAYVQQADGDRRAQQMRQTSAAAQSERVDQATAQAAASAPAASPADNMSAGNLAAANALGQRLAPGLKRYQMDAGNEHPIYVGKGKDGSIVFTDQANQTGLDARGLQAGDAPQGLRDRIGTQAVNGRHVADPRADFAYSQNSLQQGAYNTRDAQGNVVQGKPVNINATNNGGLNLDSASDVTSYQNAVNAAQNDTTNPETRMANLQLLNSLHARGKTFEQQAAAASPGAGMSPAVQMDMLRMRQTGAIAEQAHQDRVASQKTQADANDRANNADYRKAANDAIATGTQGSVIASRVPRNMTPQQAYAYFNTNEGRAVSGDALSSLQKGAYDATWPIEFGDKAAVPRLTFAEADLDAANGNKFKGFMNDGENEYSRTGLLGHNNYDESLLKGFSPQNLAVLRYRDAKDAPDKYTAAQIAAFAKAAGLSK